MGITSSIMYVTSLSERNSGLEDCLFPSVEGQFIAVSGVAMPRLLYLIRAVTHPPDYNCVVCSSGLPNSLGGLDQAPGKSI